MKWCCIVFESHYDSVGKRGTSILIGRDYFSEPEFIVQHRAADIGIKDVPNTNYPVAWVSESRIFFCPWCGRDLKKWYRKEVDNLYRLGLKIPDLPATPNHDKKSK